MRKIPVSIKDHISNARYYLEAGDQLLSPMRDAVRILLLLTAWENMQIAKEELSSWAQKTIPSKKLYRSHAYKFKKTHPITRIILGSRGIPVKTETYSSDTDFERLLSICRFGFKTGSKKLAEIFKRRWHLDSFRNSLINQIDWQEMMINIYENLPTPTRIPRLEISPKSSKHL